MANSETPISRRPLAISPNAPLLDQLEALLKPHLGGGTIQRLQAYPSPRDLPNLLASGSTHLVFLDTTGDRDQALQLLEEVGRMGGHVPVIAILGGNEPDFILRCLRAGASDFLILPLTAEQVDAAFGKLSRAQPAAQEASGGKEPAKTIAVMPAKGACGATTVACNLAFQWKRTSGKKVLLVDMDPLTGNLSFLLKVKSVYSFLDALQRSNELDADLWGAMVRPVHGVDVLLAPELMLDQNQDLRDPSPILEYARHAYDVVILDTSSVYTEWNLNIARAANELLLVTTNELPALQAAQRALSYLDTNRIGRWKIRLVVNRYLRDVGLSREVIGTALHTEVFETLPSDYDAVQKALLDGKPIPASTPFGKGMVEIVERLGGKSQPAKKGSSLSGLLGLFSKTSK
jgi:pilus assembly protein CpaE